LIVVPALRSDWKGRTRYSVVIPASQYVQLYKIDYYEHNDLTGPPTGYQRRPAPQRVERARGYISAKGERFHDWPALTVSARYPIDENPISDLDGRAGMTVIALRPDEPLYVVDGQTRTLALAQLILEMKNQEVGRYPVHLDLFGNLSQEDEMDIFYDVNSNAQSVMTDLVHSIRNRAALLDADRGIALSARQTVDLVVERAVHLLDQEEGGPWQDYITWADERGGGLRHLDESGHYIIRTTPFYATMRALVKQAYGTGVVDPSLPWEGQAELFFEWITDAWHALQRSLPEIFTDQLRYITQRAWGVRVVHWALPKLQRQSDIISARTGWGRRSAFEYIMRHTRTFGQPEPWVSKGYLETQIATNRTIMLQAEINRDIESVPMPPVSPSGMVADYDGPLDGR